MTDKIKRAKDAERILNDPLYVESFELTKQAIFQKIEQTPIRDSEGLMQLRLCLKLLSDVRTNLTQILNDGKIAAFEIEEKKRLAKVRNMFR